MKLYKLGVLETGSGYLDNLDPFCYIYEPQEFVDSMNNAIAETLNVWGYDKVTDLARLAFFSLEGGKLVFYQHSQLIARFVFSNNLYKYFGLGFNTKNVPSEEGFMIANDKGTRTPCLTAARIELIIMVILITYLISQIK